jgi:succinate-semialdehyde dehydrogenase/glutarate-semialdehyde dehydrogenase
VIVSVNPATGEEIARIEVDPPARMEAVLAAAAEAQRAWGRRPIGERLPLLRALARTLREGLDEYAALITAEMGKPIAEARSEIEKCALTCDFYAEHAPAFLADREAPSSAARSAVVHDPLGVVLAIMPWNYPFWQVFRFAAPALAAGNGAVLKHAANVGLCARAVVEAFERAGAPAGLFQALMIEPEAVAGLIDDPRIAAVTLTGSTQVGALVAGQAGRALKKQVLELGGSDPFIVLADADLERAAEVAVKARFINAGQSCVNAKRFIVEDAVAEAFVDAFARRVAALRLGDPTDPATEIGPMARANLRQAVHDQVLRSVAAGAKLRLGGAPIDGAGFFYAPTILDRVTPQMAAFREETFGPVAAIVRARDAEHAIALANDTEFGLAASIWTADEARAEQLARRIEAGAVFINGLVASDPRLPFGGVKRSGYGRELGDLGIREFTNAKTLWIGPPTAAPQKVAAQ